MHVFVSCLPTLTLFQVPNASRARRIGSALKRRASSIVHLNRGDSQRDVTEQAQTAGPLSSQNIPSLMAKEAAVTSNSGSEGDHTDSKQSRPRLCSARTMAVSQSALADSAKLEPKLWLRARLVSTSTVEHLLVLSAPSFICDFWSLSMFVVALCNAYAAVEKQAQDEKKASTNNGKKVLRSRMQSRQSSLKQIFASPSSRQSKRPPSIQDHYSRIAQVKQACSMDSSGPVADSVSFQEIALREAEGLQRRRRTKLWELWEGQATLTVLTRQGKKKVKPAPVLHLPVHVRGETARRTALIRSARTRTGACAVGKTFTSFKFLKVSFHTTVCTSK